jgi:DNA-directed RNA polymerase specialized sigma24 family protein
MTTLPKHIETQLHRLIREGLPADEIAFVMRLSRETVESEMSRLNTTGKKDSPKTGQPAKG